MQQEFRIMHNFCRLLGIAALLLCLGVLVACSDIASGVSAPTTGGSPIAAPPTTGSGDLGATAGGVQDFKIARRIVSNGELPPLETLYTEGIFSEYDLPLDGPKCEKLLCLTGALGYGPDEHSTDSAWMQIGMSSGLDAATLVRPSLSLVLVVDISGSMNEPYSTSQGKQTPLEVAKTMVNKIVPQLNSEDEVAIVTFSSKVKTDLGFTAGDKHEEILSLINELTPRGSTAMADGLKRAYALANEGTGTERRVMLFSDEKANQGTTAYWAFQQIVNDGNPGNIGLTLFGIGDKLRTDTYGLLSTTRGGNAFTLYDATDVDQVMEESWPFLAYPLAYDLKLRLLVPERDFDFVEAYGFPADYGNGNYTQEVRSVFLSQRRGATLVRFVPSDENFDKFVISASLTYESARPTELVNDVINLEFSREDFDGASSYYQQESVRKTVILATFVEGIRHAMEAYIGYGTYNYGTYNSQELAPQHSPVPYPRPDKEKAKELMNGVVADITAAAAIFDELQGEVELANKILNLMKKDAPVAKTYRSY